MKSIKKFSVLLLFFILILVVFFIIKTCIHNENDIKLVREFLHTRQQNDLANATVYLDNNIEWHSAAGCNYVGKQQTLAFLEHVQGMKLDDILIFGPAVVNKHIQLQRQLSSEKWRTASIDSLIEIDEVTVKDGKIAKWDANFSSESLKKIKDTNNSQLFRCH